MIPSRMPLNRNIPLACAYNFFQMCLVVVPVLVPYWASLGLSLSDTLEIQAVFGLSVALFEIPTGYLADLWSRKASIVLGSFMYGLCFTYLPFATTYASLVGMEVALGCAISLASGADTALVYDSIPPETSSTKVMGSLSVWSLLGETFASLLAAILVMWSFTAVTFAQTVVGWCPFLLSLFFIEPPIERMSRHEHLGNFRGVFRFIFLDDHVVRLIFLNAVTWCLSTFCVVWIQQEYWGLQGVPVSYFGYIWAALMLIAALASKVAHPLERRYGAPLLLMVMVLCPCIGYLLMVIGTPAIGVTAAILFYVSRGLVAVILQDAFNWKVPSQFRATANSIKNLSFRLFASILTPLVGVVIAHGGMEMGLLGLGALFSILALTLMLPLHHLMKVADVGVIPERNDNG